MVAGFFAADGCVDDVGQRVNITLCEKDKDHLDKIRKLLEYSGPLYVGRPIQREITNKHNGKKYIIGKNQTSILVISRAQQWIKDLNDVWKITPRKTFTLEPPPLTDRRLQLCYLSGLIDGDGWITLNKTPENTYGCTLEISVMGAKELMEWTKTIFDAITPANTGNRVKSTKSKDIRCITLRGMRAYQIAKTFLALDIPRLDRKWDKAREFIRLVDSNPLTVKMKRMIGASAPDSEASIALTV